MQFRYYFCAIVYTMTIQRYKKKQIHYSNNLDKFAYGTKKPRSHENCEVFYELDYVLTWPPSRHLGCRCRGC